MKAFAVIGYHHTGKTTVVTELIKSLTAKGFRVATIKDIHNENYHADTEGSNTWKHIQAGAVMTFAKGLYNSSLLFPHSLSLMEITALMNCDFLIMEGIKTAPVPKILCAENTQQLEELFDDTVFAISGKISTQQRNWEEPPIYDIFTESESLTNLVLEKVFALLPDSDLQCCQTCGLTCYQMAEAILRGERKRSDCCTDSAKDVTVTIDGRQLTIVPFVQNLLKDVITSFIGNLKDADSKGNIVIEIKNHD